MAYIVRRPSSPTYAGLSSGFTVIETLFVLAIGGLILLIILMAIPTLVRNGHNGQRKQDVASILQAVSRYELNHSGTYPDQAECAAGPVLPCYLAYAKLSYYEPGNIMAAGNGPLQGDTSVTGLDQVTVRHYYKCSPGGIAKSGGAGYRDIVALYAIETANGSASQCQQL